ncbi:MAG TPA: Ku protein [candidate division Zixibacteria bacterium]|nr:Ku protein [candidate division Zixibacteria bacterium]
MEEEPIEELSARIPKRPFWSGTVTIGLVNVPVKLYTFTFDKAFSFRLLHKQDGQPLKYQRVCAKDNAVVPWEDTVRGYEVSKNRFIVFKKEELDAARPQSSQKIRIDKFVDYLSIDPIYFERSYILAPDKSNEAYSLLLTSLQKTQKAGAGRITLKTKEYPVLLHAYKGALVLTTLRYADEISDPKNFEELKGLKEPEKKELDLAVKIINDLSGEFDITEYQDTYEERIRKLIAKKLKGETIVAEKPVKEEAKELMTALQQTLSQLKKR